MLVAEMQAFVGRCFGPQALGFRGCVFGPQALSQTGWDYLIPAAEYLWELAQWRRGAENTERNREGGT